MTQQQQNEFEEVNIQDILDGLAGEIAQLSKDKAIEKAKNKNLINLVTQARGFVAELSTQVEELTAQVNAPKDRKPQDRKPRTTKPQVETLSGDVIEADAEAE